MTDWDALTEAFLHDPPDKALAIRGHEERAARYLAAAGLHARPGKGRTDDILAAVAERVPMPSGRGTGLWEAISVSPEGGTLTIAHPLSGAHRRIDLPPLDEQQVRAALERVANGRGGRERFLLLWRLLPGALTELHPAYALLPADTRLPDHTLWHHADITAALHAATAGSAGGPAFLSLQLGPVQPFIQAARSLRDLWSGSFILSHLVFSGLLPIVERLGPQCLVFPYLRGNARLDRWLREAVGLGEVPAPADEALAAPCLPHRFVAVVPAAQAGELAEACEAAVRAAWRELAGEVRALLTAQGAAEEDLLGWEPQVEGFFDVRTSALAWRDERGEVDARVLDLLGAPPERGKEPSLAAVMPDAASVRALADAIPRHEQPGYPQDKAGRWQLLLLYSARLAEAGRSIRHVPPRTDEGGARPKCSLLGTVEAMGPPDHEGFRAFWESAPERLAARGIRVRARERLSAVALVKRYAAGPLRACVGLGRRETRFDDTATVAASRWLERHPRVDRRPLDTWSGQWLHWGRRDQGADRGEPSPPEWLWEAIREARRDPPPAYLAVIQLDGDHMGEWLRGARAPRLEQVMHEKLVRYYRGLGRADIEAALRARRPLGPALHAAMSAALGDFAAHLAPDIVARRGGELVYAGGDDVLALVPVEEALACAQELERAFRGDPHANGGAEPGYCRLDAVEAERLTMGQEASVSAGVAVVHYKEDLRLALATARAAEHAAKEAGRGRLGLAVCRRSGEHSSVVVPWRMVDALDRLRRAFGGAAAAAAPGDAASDRWAYMLRREAPSLEGLGAGAWQREVRRLLSRSEGASVLEVPVLELLGAFADAVGTPPGDEPEQRMGVLELFSVLVQSASFLARGRDL